MAIKSLKTLTFPDLNNTYTIPQENGNYPDLHAGLADQIMSDKYTTDSVPYLYRQTPSHAGTREMDEIVGGSIVWNQVAKYLVGTSTSNGITSTVKEDGTRTLQGTATALWSSNSPDSTHPDWANDVIYFCGCPKGGSAETFYTRNGYDARPVYFDTGDGKIVKGHANGFIYQMVVQSGTTIDATFTPQAFNLTKMLGTTIADHIYNLERATAGAGVEFFRKYFPEEYYAYDAGTIRSVEGLQSHDMVGKNLFNKDDYDYINAYLGSGKIVSATGHVTIYIKCTPNTTYICSRLQTVENERLGIAWAKELPADNVSIYNQSGGTSTASIGSVIARATTTGQDAKYLVIWAWWQQSKAQEAKDTLQIEIGSTATEYEPYSRHTYPLDSTVTLRGVPQLVDGKIKWDGDVYDASGVVTRRYGIVDLGTLNFAYSTSLGGWQSSILSTALDYTNPNFIAEKYLCVAWDNRAKGLLTCTSSGRLFMPDSGQELQAPTGLLIYPLATPTTEQAEPYQEVQICSPYGTEEYVTTGIVPVGHYTKYPTDLRTKLENLPTDFSNLIANTETTTKASKNYSVGDYLIYDNTLYKVKTAIATGGTITIGTNVIATTIMAEIKALQ